MNQIKILLLGIISFTSTRLYCQQWQKSLITLEGYGYLIAQSDNNFRVVAQQRNRVTKNQLSATIYYNSGKSSSLLIEEGVDYFRIRPDSVGKVKIQIKVGDTIESKVIRVVPMTAVGKLSSFKANHEGTIGPGEFKAQRGLNAVVECCGFDAKCEIFSYEVYRITQDYKVERTLNKGGVFDEKTRLIIDGTQPGDLYLFRKIKYKCPGSTQLQRLEDMTFEIK